MLWQVVFSLICDLVQFSDIGSHILYACGGKELLVCFIIFHDLVRFNEVRISHVMLDVCA